MVGGVDQKGTERSVELKKEQKKRESWGRKDRIAEDKKRKGGGGKKEQTCNAVSCLTGPPAPTLTACQSVCRWRHCREEGFHTGWCHPFTFPPPFFYLLSNTLSLRLCSLHTWPARLCAGGWDGFRKQVNISAVCPSLGIWYDVIPFRHFKPVRHRLICFLWAREFEMSVTLDTTANLQCSFPSLFTANATCLCVFPCFFFFFFNNV